MSDASWEGARRPWGGSQRGYSVRSGQPTVLGHTLRGWLGRDPSTRAVEWAEGGSSEEAPLPVFLFPRSPPLRRVKLAPFGGILTVIATAIQALL